DQSALQSRRRMATAPSLRGRLPDRVLIGSLEDKAPGGAAPPGGGDYNPGRGLRAIELGSAPGPLRNPRSDRGGRPGGGLPRARPPPAARRRDQDSQGAPRARS